MVVTAVRRSEAIFAKVSSTSTPRSRRGRFRGSAPRSERTQEPHIVPLSPQAVACLRRLEVRAGGVDLPDTRPGRLVARRSPPDGRERFLNLIAVAGLLYGPSRETGSESGSNRLPGRWSSQLGWPETSSAAFPTGAGDLQG